MEKQHFLNLVDKHLNGKSTPAEQALLEEYYKRLDEMSTLQLAEEEEHASKELIMQRIKTIIGPEVHQLKPTVRPFYKTWYAAAAVLLILGFGSYFVLFNKNEMPANQGTVAQKEQIRPGSNKAVLTLGNGQQITLTDADNGVLANQGKTQIVKKANGELSYQAPSHVAGAGDAVSYNTITTPKGGQYLVVLADGSRVLLNAASSLTYPTVFKGRQRNIELKGEGYFEVAKNKAMPFVVKANDVEVRVLGTHFNISAYADDQQIATTLIEGSVSLNKGKATTLLKPGQQGITRPDFNGIVVQNANVEQVMGWVNGNFVFRDLNIKEVMKMVGRWYDVDVEYRGNVQSKKFGGITSRQGDIKELLDYMKKTGGVNYKIEGRRVILTN